MTRGRAVARVTRILTPPHAVPDDAVFGCACARFVFPLMTTKSTGCFRARVRQGGKERNVSNAGILAAGCLLMLATVVGCASGQYTYVTTIGTGERLEFPLEKGVPAHAKKGTIEIMHAGLLPPMDVNIKQSAFAFAYSDESGVPAQSVVVEDVSDPEPRLMFEDKEPKLEGNQWRGISRLYSGDDPALHWLGHLGDTMRVFRFTIVKPNGQKVVLHQAWSAPGWMKSSMRKAFGLPPL